jgi:hypothetical protein
MCLICAKTTNTKLYVLHAMPCSSALKTFSQSKERASFINNLAALLKVYFVQTCVAIDHAYEFQKIGLGWRNCMLS